MHEHKSGGALSPCQPLSRREFVQRISWAAAGGGLAAAGLSILTPTQRAEAAELVADQVGKIQKIRMSDRLGRMEVGRIAIASDWGTNLFGPALAMGMNFVHKAGYWKSLPPEFQHLDRESFYTDITIDTTPDHPDDEDRAYSQVISTLEQNGLKYYDIFRAQFGWRSVDAFKNQTGTYRAFQRLKREGKVKYFGVSQHPYVPYPEIIQAEIDSGIIDSMQVWFSASTSPEILEVFAHAGKAGIGMTAMKTYNQGHEQMVKDPDLQRRLGSEGMPGRACLRYALATTSPVTNNRPVFHMAVSQIRDLETLAENAGAAGARAAARDGFILNV